MNDTSEGNPLNNPMPQWAGVIEAIQEGDDQSAWDALDAFCGFYRPVIYNFFRQSGIEHADADEYTHEFFLTKIHERWDIREGFLFDAPHDKEVNFRCFLRAVLRKFLRDKRRVQHRKSLPMGESDSILSTLATQSDENPERFYGEVDRAIASEIIQRVEKKFPFLKTFVAHVSGEVSRAAAAERLGLSPEAFAKSYSRFRKSFGEELRREVGRLVGPGKNEIDDEIKHLLSVLANSENVGETPLHKSALTGHEDIAKLLMRSKAVTTAEAVSSDFVRFSAFLPQFVQKGSSFVLEVWAYLESQRPEVLARAVRHTGAVERAETGPVRVVRGAEMTFQLCLDGFDSSESLLTATWASTPANVGFRVRVPKSLATGNYSGFVRVSRDSVPVAVLHFDVHISSVSESEVHEFHEQRVRSVFASYADEDRPEVVTWARGAEAVGVEVFIDVKSMREGQDWEKDLWTHVPSKDMFCLFWSEPASRSDWVNKEWRCALATRGMEYVHPVPLVDPRDVPPPPELASSKHFHDMMFVLYVYERRRRER